MIINSRYYGSYSNSKVATINPYIEGYVEWSEKYHPRRFFAASTVVKDKFGYLEVWLPIAPLVAFSFDIQQHTKDFLKNRYASVFAYHYVREVSCVQITSSTRTVLCHQAGRRIVCVCRRFLYPVG